MSQWRLQVYLGLGILGLLAGLGLFFWPKAKKTPLATAVARNTATTPTNAAAATPGAPAATNLVTAKPRTATPSPIDRRAILERWPDWVAGRSRDPFQIIVPASLQADQDPELTPARHLKLAATWLQTGKRLAVIDRQVYGPGDKVAGYTVLQIEPGRVDLQGPGRVETITFYTYVPPPPPRQGGLINTNLIEKLLGPEKEKLRN
jgi:hypothetical protein